MQRMGVAAAIAATFGLLLALAAGAQPGMRWRGSGGWGPGSQYNRMYDPKTVETIRGEVVSVETFTPMSGMSGGVHLMVKTDRETVSVHLDPA
jgi:hypothetical protein